jgi:deoxyribodipyrimidine photo-lyase
MKINIYWSRRDFRLHDNPALFECIKSCEKYDARFLPIFILEDYMTEAKPGFQFGYPSRYFLAKCLPEFAKNFERFEIVKGKGIETILNIQESLKKEDPDCELTVFVNEDVYIDFYKQIEKLKSQGVQIKVFNDQLTVSKDTKSGAGSHYSVFTPFKKAVWEEFLRSEVFPPVHLKKIKYFEGKVGAIKVANDFASIWHTFSKNRFLKVAGHTLDIDTELNFVPDFESLGNFYYTEGECLKRFSKYLEVDLFEYKENRDSLEKDKTSKMSLGLAWGLVSARTLKQEILKHFKTNFLDINWFKLSDQDAGPIHFLSELIWREFYKYLLFHNQNLMNQEFQEKFRGKIQWTDEKNAMKRFKAWIHGETGYKVVDAAMMQLAKSGWMHNRSRMIVASILTKNLGVDWRWGQEYFRAMLLDLDEASNNGGWQWGASVGADPKPIRIFNPYLQAENYDKKNVYQKKWLGEEKFSLVSEPLVEHKDARNDALRRYGLEKDAHGTVRDY